MALRSSSELLLFVGSEPELTPSVREAGTGMGTRLSEMFVGGGVLPSSLRSSGKATLPSESSYERPPLTENRPWHVPPSHLMCEDIVLEIAGQLGLRVRVIDANQPAGDRALVEEWVRPDDVLPLLVRGDGARLDGVENFVRPRVRRFLEST